MTDKEPTLFSEEDYAVIRRYTKEMLKAHNEFATDNPTLDFPHAFIGSMTSACIFAARMAATGANEVDEWARECFDRGLEEAHSAERRRREGEKGLS